MSTIALPPEIERALAISISGGKDSQAMLSVLVQEHRRQQWPGPIFAIHAHLGRAEWPQSLPHCEALCAAAGLPLYVVERSQGDLVDRLHDRMRKLQGTGKPFWPSAASRYCTSDLKRGPINKHLRRYQQCISAEGIRSAESASRCQKAVWEARRAITTLSRQAFTWNPIKDWSLAEVWAACGTTQADLDSRRQRYRQGEHAAALSGWPAHPAYVFGNERVSCALCVLATRNDLQVGADHNPALLQEYIRLEEVGGATFKQGFSLKELERGHHETSAYGQPPANAV